MLKRFLIISVSLVLTFFYAKYAKDSFLNNLKSQENKSGELLATLPGVTFTSLDGKDFDFSNVEKSFFAIHFWATWCAPCKVEFPELLKLSKKHSKKLNFYLVAVNDDKKKVEKYIEKYKSYIDNVNIVVLLDDNKEYYAKFGTAKVPETYVFKTSDKGMLRKFTGPQPWERSFYSSYFTNL